MLTPEEWQQRGESFDLLIDMDMDITPPRETKAVVNQDSLTGSFCIPDRSWIDGPRRSFSFALDEKGIILVDGSGYAEELVQSICRTKKWRLPSLERFLYDLLETTIGQDLALLEKSEHQLNQLEEAILRGEVDSYPAKMNDIRAICWTCVSTMSSSLIWPRNCRKTRTASSGKKTCAIFICSPSG